MEIRQVVNTIFNSCSYVLTQDCASWIVDCGDVDLLLPLISGRVKGVMITHAHFDHIYGLNHLLALFPGIPVMTNQAGYEGLLSDKLNYSRYHETPFVLDTPEVIKIVDDGECVNLFGDIDVQAIYTPGHSPCSVTWKVGEALFTGDSYIPGLKTVTNFPNSDRWQAQLSREYILQLAESGIVYPGHPSPVKAEEFEHNKERIKIYV